MGYSEVHCQFCGVSFNIGRIRKPDDVPEHGWSGSNQDSFIDGTEDEDERLSQTGCQNYEVPEAIDPDDRVDEDQDAESAGEESEKGSGKDEEDEKMTEASDEEDADDEKDNEGGVSSEADSEEVPNESCDEGLGDKEHIAGPGCTNSSGYNGYRITAEEMIGCKTAQAIYPKLANDPGDPDDLECELKSKFFLTGLCRHFPSRDMGWPSFEPGRHRMDPGEDIYVDESLYDPSRENEAGVPFHPACFDIFSRISRLRLGFTDLDGLFAWRMADDGDMGPVIKRDRLVKRASRQWWVHEPGSEFLAANPVLIPALPALLKSVLRLEDPSFSIKNSAFPRMSSGATSIDSDRAPNVFERLPQEMLLEITSNLGSRDIANLRLTSRSFSRLPISLWYQLVRAEMPWLYEAWDDAEPSPWVVSYEEIFAALDDQEEKAREAIGKQSKENQASQAYQRPWKVPEMIKLPLHGTNWYQLYTLITRNWSQLKGLRNRERIWKDVEEIVGRIQRLRAEGTIP